MGGDLRVRSVLGAGSALTVTLRRVASAGGEALDRRAARDRRDAPLRRSGAPAHRRGPARDDGAVHRSITTHRHPGRGMRIRW
jgi:hypothetical protein